MVYFEILPLCRNPTGTTGHFLGGNTSLKVNKHIPCFMACVKLSP